MRKKIFILLSLVLITVSFSIATEVFARLVDDDPLLGEKHLFIIYEPFHIIFWYLSLEVNGNQFAIAFSLLSVLVLAGIICLTVLYKRVRVDIRNTYGSSRWMKNTELKKEGLLEEGGCILGQTNDATYSYNKARDEWRLRKPGTIIFNNSKEHLLIVAPTRRGKGINFVVPTLLSWTDSAVVYDIKKENWSITAGWRKKFSHVIRFEPAAPYSARFNPLYEIEKGPREVSLTQNVVEILCDPNGTGESDHWQKTANQLLTGVILHILYTGKNKTLAGVYEFLNNPEMDIMRSLTVMLETNHLGQVTHPVIAQTARNMLNKSEKELSGVVSTASSYLYLYQDPYVQNNTSSSDFSIRDLMNADHPVSLYLVVSPQDSDRMRPLIRLILQMIGKKLTEQLGQFKHRLLFMIDEFPTLGNLQFFESQLAFFAGYGIKCALITQSFNQLYKYYTKNTSIMDNCRYKLILGADNPDEAALISKYLGQETLVKQSASKSGKISSFLMNSKSVSESEVGRTLMTPDEVLRLPYDDILLLAGGTYPYRGKKIMYFTDSRFSERANLEAPESREAQEKELIKRTVQPWCEQEHEKRENDNTETIKIKEEKKSDMGNTNEISINKTNEWLHYDGKYL